MGLKRQKGRQARQAELVCDQQPSSTDVGCYQGSGISRVRRWEGLLLRAGQAKYGSE